MAYTVIDNSTEFFDTNIWTGNGSTQNITSLNFQPDFVWGKVYSEVGSHRLIDSTRGNTKALYSNGTDNEGDETNFSGFLSNGYGLANASLNESNRTYIAWNWKANGGTATATISESGNNPAAVVQANQTTGFSIITYTGTGANGTIAHGLGVIPKMIIIKRRTGGAVNWVVYFASKGNTHYTPLNTKGAMLDDATIFNDTSPTSSVFTISSNALVNHDGSTYVAYCYADVQGFSKQGKYVGNGNADGEFVYTGFRPQFMIMRPDADKDWYLVAGKHLNGFNSQNKSFYANANATTVNTDNYVDFVSNGFKLRTTDNSWNGSSTYHYIAFADQPIVSSSGIPAVAK